MIVRGATIAELRKAGTTLGMKTLREAGIDKVLEGVTTIEEMLRVTLV
jgi:type IV pilus assembly protein PilB